jgi:hypothetical protein
LSRFGNQEKVPNVNRATALVCLKIDMLVGRTYSLFVYRIFPCKAEVLRNSAN